MVDRYANSCVYDFYGQQQLLLALTRLEGNLDLDLAFFSEFESVRLKVIQYLHDPLLVTVDLRVDAFILSLTRDAYEACKKLNFHLSRLLLLDFHNLLHCLSDVEVR